MMTAHQRAKIDAPQIKTVKAEGQWKGQFRTDLDVRDFRFVTAEPAKIGGNNEGPTPMEYVLGALNGCLVSPFCCWLTFRAAACGRSG